MSQPILPRSAEPGRVPAPPRPAVQGRAPLGAEVLPPRTALSVRNLDLWYGNTRALKHVTLDIPERRVTALIGPSGCGKSTLIRCFNRLNDLVEGVQIDGTITLYGQEIHDPALDVILLRKRVGMVFQRSNPFPASIYENVAYGLRVDGETRREVLDKVVEESLKRAALWEEVKDRLSTNALRLSGGQQQRLCIARAIARIVPVKIPGSAQGSTTFQIV